MNVFITLKWILSRVWGSYLHYCLLYKVFLISPYLLFPSIECMHACLPHVHRYYNRTWQVTLLLSWRHERKPSYWSYSMCQSLCIVMCQVALLKRDVFLEEMSVWENYYITATVRCFNSKLVCISLHHYCLRIALLNLWFIASYLLGTRVSFLGGEMAGAWSWPLTSI